MRQQSVTASRAVVASADQLATQAGLSMIAAGGNAVDAALAANAVLAVTSPHLCGLGGDLFAIVRRPDGELVGVNASGRAGSGSDAEALRAAGHTTMPLRNDLRSVTVPGCVDGWMALHQIGARLDLTTLLHPAMTLAAEGFPASPLLVGVLAGVNDEGRRQLDELVSQATGANASVRRPGVALALQAIARGGREAFYDGAFGEGLVAIGDGLFSDADVLAPHATVLTGDQLLRTGAFGVEIVGMPPNSQDYLVLGIAALADAVGLPDDPDDPVWAHLFVEAATAASHDRPAALADRADGRALLADVRSRVTMIDRSRATRRAAPAADGDTTYLCAADASGWGVSLIQSNAAGLGSWIVEPTTGINLHNRGLGFSLVPGHPAELAPGRRPPHTLSPAMVLRDGDLAAIVGTMGGDAQPQIVAQIIARLFHHGQSPATAIGAPRWALRGPASGFDTWGPTPPTVTIEAGAPTGWRDGLAALGHDVVAVPAGDGSFGHAHCITVGDGGFTAAADWRTIVGSAAGVSW